MNFGIEEIKLFFRSKLGLSLSHKTNIIELGEIISGYKDICKVVNQKIEKLKRIFSGDESQKEIDLDCNSKEVAKLETNADPCHKYSNLFDNLEDWQESVTNEYDTEEFGREDTERILEDLCGSVFSRILRCPDLDYSQREFWVGTIDDIISEIENRTETEVDQPKILRNTDLLHQLDIRVKPWLRFSGTDNALVRLSDKYGFHYNQGMTDSNGRFNAEALEGENLLVVRTKYKEKFESFEVKDDESMTVHPSLI